MSQSDQLLHTGELRDGWTIDVSIWNAGCKMKTLAERLGSSHCTILALQEQHSHVQNVYILYYHKVVKIPFFLARPLLEDANDASILKTIKAEDVFSESDSAILNISTIVDWRKVS